ncbi:MAG: 16S rRNA (adenine(1518)-N(6)/adenine(1519)-N(6))-dimethyltransferase RsmA [Candidatus Acidiferrales bacterium]
MARQRLGQHFLANESWQRRIAETLGCFAPASKRETWIEIGAGHGEMTQHLAGKGRRVVAIETDARLAKELRTRAAEWACVEVVEGDILRLDLEKIAGGKFHVYGNLPYYITSPILKRLFEFANSLLSIHIVVQLEVAERIAARPGSRDYGFFSTVCQFYASPELLFRIPPGAFRPPPKVASALVQMRIPGERASLGIQNEGEFLNFLGSCFEAKRKTLRNNLRATLPAQCVAAALAECGVRSDARAEQLTLTQFATLFRELTKNQTKKGPARTVNDETT